MYISLWATACLLAVALYIVYRKSFAKTYGGYCRFLLKPWKAVTFIIAAAFLTLMAPYTGDPTWDYTDALFMSLLTYFTAPWSIGVIYRFIKKELPFKDAYIAFCAWMFSASWSYDIYILIRGGYYPVTWFSNIFSSSALYVLAGFFWNLDWRKEKGVIFSFMASDWIRINEGKSLGD